ncbi:MAG: Rrf2 family transcriptional regulator [Deltaproteobacteria bacterium]|nr:Rrf2 family transcriptional regulator [Deltaproteobacteria bacterium]MBW2071056.1 Rrf2 family transcriptional regulator [Deltaproteobacteria bacterium]
MKLSTRGRYGTRLMVDLAKHYDNGPIPLGEIARRQNLSVKYLEQLIIPLKASGLISSVRGARGGYRLALAPAEISVGQVIEVLEGDLSLVDCVKTPELCDRHQECPTRDVWQTMSNVLREKLFALTLENVLLGAKLPGD